MSNDPIQDMMAQLTGAGASAMPSREQQAKLDALTEAIIKRAFQPRGPAEDDVDSPMILKFLDIVVQYRNMIEDPDAKASPLVNSVLKQTTPILKSAFEDLLNLAMIREPGIAKLWDEGIDRIKGMG